jgi:Kef-type K+ transport system membrane component KefB
MDELHFTNLLIIVAVAFAAPLALGLVPRLMIPAVVLEIVLGIAIGPSGLGWVQSDEPVRVLALLGLAWLLLLAGLEIDLHKLKGRPLKLAALGFGATLVLAAIAAEALHAAGLAEEPLLVAIILTATSLGIVVPLLEDRDLASTPFGQLVIAAGSIADFGAIILLSLFFSEEATGIDTKLVLLGIFAAAVAIIALTLFGAERSMQISAALVRLQDTTAQIRIRGAFLLLVGFAALAEHLGLEVILGAFAAGVILSAVDRDRAMTHTDFRAKLSAAGFGVFIPVFFVDIGLNFDLDALTSSAGAIVRVPLFLLAILAVRGLPALLYRREVGTSRALAAGLLQATTLPFIAAATMIGLSLDAIGSENAAALVAAGLLSVVLFPVLAARRLEAADA